MINSEPSTNDRVTALLSLAEEMEHRREAAILRYEQDQAAISKAVRALRLSCRLTIADVSEKMNEHKGALCHRERCQPGYRWTLDKVSKVIKAISSVKRDPNRRPFKQPSGINKKGMGFL